MSLHCAWRESSSRTPRYGRPPPVCSLGACLTLCMRSISEGLHCTVLSFTELYCNVLNYVVLFSAVLCCASVPLQVERVAYPGLESHPEHHIAVKQMKGGFGGVISFEVRGLGVGSGQRLRSIESSCLVPGWHFGVVRVPGDSVGCLFTSWCFNPLAPLCLLLVAGAVVGAVQIDGDLERTSKFIDGLRIPYIAPSLEEWSSLVEQPTIISYW